MLYPAQVRRATWVKGTSFSTLSQVTPQPPNGATQIRTRKFACANPNSKLTGANLSSLYKAGIRVQIGCCGCLVPFPSLIHLPDCLPPPQNSPLCPTMPFCFPLPPPVRSCLIQYKPFQSMRHSNGIWQELTGMHLCTNTASSQVTTYTHGGTCARFGIPLHLYKVSIGLDFRLQC